MKVWFYTLLGLIIFCAVSLGVQRYIQTSADSLTHRLQEVRTALQQKNWGQSATSLRGIQEKWNKTKPYWAILIRHLEIDAIDQALIRSEKAVESRSYPESLMELGGLNQLIKHVPEREKLSLVNVF